MARTQSTDQQSSALPSIMNTIYVALISVLLVLVSSAALAQVKITEAWVRGTVEGQRTTGAFMKLTSPADAKLVAATSPLASVEIHQMAMEGGLMKMRPVERVPLPAGKSVELKSGGYHLMLMSLKQPMKAGDVVPITLILEDSAGKRTNVEVNAIVRPLTATTDPQKH